ncbi:hypothetical protein SALWKB29_0900 [Snodgrassella communis]|uniref:Uncharacterized protein n=1 Tax=Snodgrassella communis TaxID=2946699 RepID=A0A836MR83_9NEIS|nr:hypothetical protein SALWKB29_0900 [Snodgrassella communis]
MQQEYPKLNSCNSTQQLKNQLLLAITGYINYLEIFFLNVDLT